MKSIEHLKTSFFNYKIFSGDLEDLTIVNMLGKQMIINTINPHSFCEAEKDNLFREALQKSNILLPDGIGIVLANNIINKKKIRKIAGMDLFHQLMDTLDKSDSTKEKKIFFLGSTTATLNRIKEKISFEYPQIQIGSYSPPFKAEFSNEDNSKMFESINEFNPNILFLGMTAPKQEKWVYKNKDFLNAEIICSVGAVFDFYAETVMRPHKIWIDMGLEWLIRFIHEPKRLWRRNFISSPKFIFKVLKHKFDNLRL